MVRFNSVALIAASLIAAVGATPALAKGSDLMLFATSAQVSRSLPKTCAIALASRDCAAAQDLALRAAAQRSNRAVSQEEIGRRQLDALIDSIN